MPEIKSIRDIKLYPNKQYVLDSGNINSSVVTVVREIGNLFCEVESEGVKWQVMKYRLTEL